MEKAIEVELEYGDTVSLILDPEILGTVIAYMVEPNDVQYIVRWIDGNETPHYAFELKQDTNGI